MDLLLARNSDIAIAGTAENQGKFYDRFDHVVLLSAPIEVLLERVLSRTNNPYGKTLAQQEEIRHYHHRVEPLLRAGAAIEPDATRTPEDLLRMVLTLTQSL